MILALSVFLSFLFSERDIFFIRKYLFYFTFIFRTIASLLFNRDLFDIRSTQITASDVPT